VRIAYFSPMPPERSGIADYSALLVPALSRRLEVEVVSRGATRPPRGVDGSVFHIGNNPDSHGWILRALERNRGLVVLHDFVLHHLIAGVTLGQGDDVGYLDAMQRDGGAVGRMLAHGVVDGVIAPVWETRPDEFPLVRAVLDHATSVIVHSRATEQRVRETGYDLPISVVPHPAWHLPEGLPDAQLPTDRGPIVACLGHITASKRLPQVLQAYAALRRAGVEGLLVLGGDVAPRLDLPLLVERAGVDPGDVVVTGYLPEDRLWAVICAADVCVNLRWPSMGETSGAVLRALSAGKPLVVSDVGWFSELPNAAAAKVPVDDGEVEALTRTLRSLLEDEQLRRRAGAAALAYAREEHGLEHVADRYAAAIEADVGGPEVTNAVVRDVGRAAVEVGIDGREPALRHVARALRDVLRG
jgi:glycosyltransferase involved in cell wall biosynthesis